MAVRLATRGSALALAQAAIATAALSPVATEVVVVQTIGDRKADASVRELSGQGWFTAEIERVLLQGDADIAVHSGKDLPIELAPMLELSAYLPRADCRDALVTRDGKGFEQLPEGAVIGTSSERRVTWCAALRPDLSVVPMRGNVDTRLSKLDGGQVDALILAAAGLDRLGKGDRISERFDPTVFVPAPVQGAIALEAVQGSGASTIASRADDQTTRIAVTAERAVLAGLGGGCLLPLGAWARIENGTLLLSAALAVDGDVRRVTLDGPLHAAAELGARAAEILGR